MLNDTNEVKEIDRYELTSAGNFRQVELISRSGRVSGCNMYIHVRTYLGIFRLLSNCFIDNSSIRKTGERALF